MELQGRVVAVTEQQSGTSKSTGNPWMKQDYVIETHEQFPKRMMFTVFGEDKIKQFNIQLGEEINVFFDINAREWNGRYYNDIRAWRIDRVDPNQPTQAAVQQPVAGAEPMPPAPTEAPAQPQEPVFNQNNAEDDLPF